MPAIEHGVGIVVEFFESCNPHFRHNRDGFGQVGLCSNLPMQLRGNAIRLILKDTAIRWVALGKLVQCPPDPHQARQQ